MNDYMKFEKMTTYFMNNDPKGVRVCKIAGSGIDTYVIPRPMLAEAKKCLGDEVKRYGVYFLVGNGENGTCPKMKMYAGKTKNGLVRLVDHKYDKKDFWTLGIMFLANEFDDNTIAVLEKVAIKGVVESKRYECDNKIDPKYKIEKYQRQTVERYYANIKFIMASLGYELDAAVGGNIGEWHTSRNGIVANGRFDGGKFELLSGSQIDLTRKTCGDKWLKERDKLIARGELKEQGDGKGVLQISMTFMTPSGASDFVLGCNTNGWKEWKNDKGEQLEVIRN